MASERIGKNGSNGGSGQGRGAADPDTIVAEIEATREDLAETLELIADKVSPKRVVQRGKEQLSESVRSGAITAREFVTEKAAIAKEVVTEKTAIAKEVVTEKTATAREAVTEKTATARGLATAKASGVRQAVSSRTGSGDTGVDGVVLDGGSGASIDALPPATGVEVPSLAPSRPSAPTAPLGARAPGQLPGGSSTYVSGTSGLRPEVLAGAAAALLGLYLLRRRSR